MSPVRVLLCPDSFTGTLTAVQAARAMAEGWRTRAPHDEITMAPLSEGCAGFVDVVEAALGGTTIGVTVSDPLGRDVPATVLMVEAGGVRTAYIEAAQAAGLHLLGAGERDPRFTSTYGVGQLIDAALVEGASRVVVALGGTGTNDGGAGMLAALRVGETQKLASGGLSLAGLDAGDLYGLTAARERFSEIELIAASQEQIPLLGFGGCSATTSPIKGADIETSQQLERALGVFVDTLEAVLPSRPDLLTGLPRRLERQPGAGAGGGLGYGLFALGAVAQSAVDIVMHAWDFDDLLSRHDLVVTGEGRLDARSLASGAVVEVSQAAMQHAIPTIVLAGQVEVGRRETMAAGLSGTYAIADRPEQIASAMADPVGTLEARAARLAATWSV
ncbi:MAG: glycerate kinase [Dermatophilus congolensis]|nr:glycerate kinase [Dermatophilus congolensis]